ncbi:39S ribosomal protein L15, mitochondrial [Copidosoma floridanum]|uniref:39S ribosomal protein L15, mitochondrial n=1 Tax=Copidosoma floridanum TaxID=29053 RepID=UPI0006C98C19|nr:39S ribosomal protein L15, mitochondrial [Copidosoma floridanum]
MAHVGKQGRELALTMLRALPRVCLANITNPGSKKKTKRGRGQHGGDKHGGGDSNQRNNWMPLGYETGNRPFHKRFSEEPYYKGHHLRRQYPPLSLQQLQLMIDTNRVDTSKLIDLTAISNTGVYKIEPDWKHYGVHLTDEGADQFQAKINIEVQWASEPVIAAIERNGGRITTAYYDLHCVYAAINPQKFFKKGAPIPRRLLPPADCLEYYSSAATRGYLADPEKISYERLVLSQKYGYELPKIENDPDFEILMESKDPRQIFFGLEPGWVVSLKDKCILKPKAEYLREFYAN